MSLLVSASTPQVATVNDNEVDILQKFVVMMYDKSSTATGVNNARLDMFARKQRPYQAIPPTRSALLQHIKRDPYQAGCIWSQSTLRQPETQSPADWGWAKNGDLWNVVWTMLPPIVESCQQVTKCGIKSECHGRLSFFYRIGLSSQHCVVADTRLRHHMRRHVCVGPISFIRTLGTCV